MRLIEVDQKPFMLWSTATEAIPPIFRLQTLCAEETSLLIPFWWAAARRTRWSDAAGRSPYTLGNKWINGLEFLDHEELGFWGAMATTDAENRGRKSAMWLNWRLRGESTLLPTPLLPTNKSLQHLQLSLIWSISPIGSSRKICSTHFMWRRYQN